MMRWMLPTILLLSVAATAPAQSLFNLNVVGTNNTVNVGGSSVLDLVDHLSNHSDQFTPFGTQDYTASLTYAGISNAVQLTQTFDSSGNRVVNVNVPTTGLNRSFSSANGSITTQIRDFLKTQGLAQLSAFQAIVNKTSLAGVVDGNPMAATDLIAGAGYQQFALHPRPGGGSDTAGQMGWYSVEGGAVAAGGISGSYLDVTLGSEFHFNDTIGLSLISPFRWLRLQGANVYMGGVVLGLPITIIHSEDDKGISWQVTPAGHTGAVGSADFASGGLLFGGQVDSSLNYTIDGFTFTLADQAGYYRGASLDVAGYHFNTNLNQWLFKNGLQMTKTWGPVFVDVSATWTNRLHNAYVDGYLTPEAGIGFRFGQTNASGIRIAYTGNFGTHYHTNGGNIMLFIAR